MIFNTVALKDWSLQLSRGDSNYQSWGIQSLAVPPLGAGSGGLEWSFIGPTLHRYLGRLNIPVELYAPYEVPEKQLQLAFLASESRPTPTNLGLLSVASILDKLRQRPYSPPVGRTAFQKLAFFATEAGIPTHLEYAKGSYGPFSRELKRLTSALINNGLVRESPSPWGRMIAVLPGPAFKEAHDEHADQLAEWEEAESRVVDLMSRIRTTDQAEVAATIVFSVKMLTEQLERVTTDAEVLDYVQEWKKTRTGWFASDQVAQAMAALHSLDWIKIHSTESVRGLELAELSE